jgi:mono/diheme cytochrome c family protein
MVKRILLGIVALVVLGVVGVAALAYRPAIAPVTPPRQFAPGLIAQGQVLAAGGYCAACHTANGGQPFAGGYAMETGFGTIHSTNITPDPQTGIGNWSEAAFRRAMHEGVARDGSHLFPAFPYDHFTRLSDADVGALYAYMMTRTPVKAPPKPNALPFPLDVRALQAGWKLLFFKAGRFEANPARDAEWNRGAYLADALGHCGACHTPRNALGAEQRDHAYAGAMIDGWIAPALTAANPSPMPWTTPELAAYLTKGVSLYHGTAVGPMSAVVHDGLAKLSPADRQAVTRYIESLGGGDARAAQIASALTRATAAGIAATARSDDPDARLFTAACGSCHYGAGTANALRPDIALNTAVALDDPTNLIRVILHGVGARQGAPGIVMPGFIGLTDRDVARLAAYIRKSQSARPVWTDLESKVAAVRAQGRGES